MNIRTVVRIRASFFLTLLLLIIVGYPWVKATPLGASFFSTASVLVILGGLLEVQNDRRWLFPTLALAIPTGILSILESVRLGPGYPVLSALQGAIYSLLTVNFVLFALRPGGRVDGQKLSAIINGYLMLGFTFSTFYRIVSSCDPGAFTSPRGGSLDSFDALYFSFVTLTTLGYGDISPISDRARAIAIIEAVFGTMYLVVLVSRMVTEFGREAPASAKPQ